MADRRSRSRLRVVNDATELDINAVRQALKTVFECFHLTDRGTIVPIVRENAGAELVGAAPGDLLVPCLPEKTAIHFETMRSGGTSRY